MAFKKVKGDITEMKTDAIVKRSQLSAGARWRSVWRHIAEQPRLTNCRRIAGSWLHVRQVRQ